MPRQHGPDWEEREALAVSDAQSSTSSVAASPSLAPKDLRWSVRLRRFCFVCLRNVAIVWSVLAVLGYQAKFIQQGLHLHPFERLAAVAPIEVNLYAVTIEATVLESVTDFDIGLGALKSLAETVKERFARRSDSPANWHLHADANDIYEMVRYEGLSTNGTYWAVTAYRRGGDIRLAVRRETRQLPDDLRRDVMWLRKELQRGAGVAVRLAEPRLMISGRTAALRPIPTEMEIDGLIGRTIGGELRRLYRDGPEVRASLFSPQFPGEAGNSAGVNVIVHLMPEGDSARITLGTPDLGEMETQIATGSLYVYNPAISGQTMAEEVR